MRAEDGAGVTEREVDDDDDWARLARGSTAAAAKRGDGDGASYAGGDERGALNPLVPVDAPDAMVVDDRGYGASAATRAGFGVGGEGEGAAASAEDDERAEEFAFAEVLSRVKREGIGAGAAAAMFEDACWLRARELRTRSETRRRRAPSLANKDVEEAEALEREAHSWSLIYHLLGDGATVERESAAKELELLDATPRVDGGASGDFLAPPLRSRLRCASRDEARDPVTFRLNRIIAWLEANAASALRRAELDGTAYDGRFCETSAIGAPPPTPSIRQPSAIPMGILSRRRSTRTDPCGRKRRCIPPTRRRRFDCANVYGNSSEPGACKRRATCVPRSVNTGAPRRSEVRLVGDPRRLG